MEDLLEGLNEAQREAVTATEGFVRVIACLLYTSDAADE